jgi:hypothetical protein
MQHYIEDYLSFRLILSGEEQPHPKCVVCCEKLANQAMVPGKLKRHLHTIRSHLCEKPTEYFKMLIWVTYQTCQAKQRTEITTISDKAEESSYATAKIVAKKNHIQLLSQ